MRCVVLIGVMWLLSGGRALADSVVFVSSHARSPEWASALTQELVIYGVTPRYRRSPDARSPLERAAQAQRVARNLGATAAIWLEESLPGGSRVRAVTSEGEYVAEAILPSKLMSLDPQVLASLAASVLLDAMGRTAPIAASCEVPIMLSMACACEPQDRGMPAWSQAEKAQ